jgi:hypothetical protein
MPASGGGGGFSLANIGRFLKENPELVSSVLSTGADIYGTQQQANAFNRQLEFQEGMANRQQAFEEEREREARKRQEIAMLMQAMVGMRPRY